MALKGQSAMARTSYVVSVRAMALGPATGLVLRRPVAGFVSAVDTPDRQAKFAFSQPYVYDGAQVVVKLGNETEITGVDSLRGRTVAVNLGSNFEQLLRELPFAAEIDIRTYESNVEQDTALGRVDAFVMDRVSSAQVIKESPLPLALAGPPFSEIQNALPFRNDAEGLALRDRLDAALTEMKADGTLRAISEKWLGLDVTAPAG